MFFDKVLTKIFGTANERLIKRLMPMVAMINALEAGDQGATDEELRAKTVEFRARIAAKLEGITDADEMKAAERRRWTRFCPRRLRWCARRAGARCRCATLTCS